MLQIDQGWAVRQEVVDGGEVDGWQENSVSRYGRGCCGGSYEMMSLVSEARLVSRSTYVVTYVAGNCSRLAVGLAG